MTINLLKKKSSRPAPTYYAVLGVPPASSYQKLHERYRALAVEQHPDKGGDAEKFKAIALAWGVLRDAERRRKYDAQLLLEGRFSCITCGGKGLRTGFAGRKFLKEVLCESCNGTGEQL